MTHLDSIRIFLLTFCFCLLQTNRETSNSTASVNKKKSVGAGVKYGTHFRLWRTSPNGLKVTNTTEDNSKTIASSHKTRSSSNRSSDSSSHNSDSCSNHNGDMTMLQLLAFVIILLFLISLDSMEIKRLRNRLQLLD